MLAAPSRVCRAILPAASLFFSRSAIEMPSPSIRRPNIPPQWPYSPSDYQRMDPSPDPAFYVSPRFVTHIDDGCIDALSKYYGSVLPPTREGLVLDLCSSWISHLPEPYAGRVYGIGLNQVELEANTALTEGYAVLDLNASPRFPDLQDGTFDAVICSVSIDYLTQPRQVLAEVARVLKPGGSAHMAFSNRCFPTKVVQRWLRIDEDERCDMVAHAFAYASASPDGTSEPTLLYKDVEIVELLPRNGRGDPLWVVRATKA